MQDKHRNYKPQKLIFILTPEEYIAGKIRLKIMRMTNIFETIAKEIKQKKAK